jgi:hypothetical protein
MGRLIDEWRGGFTKRNWVMYLFLFAADLALASAGKK